MGRFFLHKIFKKFEFNLKKLMSQEILSRRSETIKWYVEFKREVSRATQGVNVSGSGNQMETAIPLGNAQQTDVEMNMANANVQQLVALPTWMYFIYLIKSNYIEQYI